jgi:DNA (cytosine-5)-methyltransferase 1
LKAVDLYSGVGGWSLGLSMAGIDIVASYDFWAKANLTNSKNNGHPATKVDIRSLDPGLVPSVDIVVGSPPCTHFSLANRGGNGNIYEGLKDVEKFLEIVDAVRPKFWAMENVPRLASIACKELDQGGILHRFCHLKPDFMVLDLSEWGVPQRRQRFLMGNLDFDVLLSYRNMCRTAR